MAIARGPSRRGPESLVWVVPPVGRATCSGPRFEFGFSFFSELVKVYSIQFLADLWKMIVNIEDVQK